MSEHSVLMLMFWRKNLSQSRIIWAFWGWAIFLIIRIKIIITLNDVTHFVKIFASCAENKKPRTQIFWHFHPQAGYKNGEDVVLTVSLDKVMVTSVTRSVMMMSHSLKRISYATCDPASCLFSFMSRHPTSQHIQQCHTFRQDSSLVTPLGVLWIQSVVVTVEYLMYKWIILGYFKVKFLSEDTMVQVLFCTICKILRF